MRWLDFGDGVIQTVIDIDDPKALPSPVNRAMLASLMFVETPGRVLLAGVGGGAIARYFQARFGDIEGVAVECSELVASIARRFFAFPDESSQWELVVSDIKDYLGKTRNPFDLILVDIAEGQFTPKWIYGTDFLQSCRQHLSSGGAVAFNLLLSDAETFSAALKAIRQIFQLKTVCLSVEDYKNIMVIAFRNLIPFENATQIQCRLPELERKWGLEFTRLLNRMRKDNPEGSGVF